jgi:hypothetical protein
LPATQPLALVLADQAQPLWELPGYSTEDSVPITKGKVERIRESVPAIAALRPDTPSFHSELHELPRVRDRKKTKKNLVHQGKDRGVGRNAEGQR